MHNNVLERTIENNVLVVAEIGKNFIDSEEEKSVSEYLARAKVLVRAAKDAGADAVKFQTHHVEDEVLPMEFDSPHFKGKGRYQWVQRNERATPLEDFWRPLQKYCNEIGIIFFSTPMSRGAAQILQKLDVPFWKVASSDILDFPMLDFMTLSGKTVIIPSGMSTLQDIDISIEFLRSRTAPFVLLHAISRYPYPAEDSNLRTITFFQKRFPNVPIGFSQNSPWVEPAVAAVALGAKVVEQHVTFDRASWGPDHKVSMIPEEFKKMVEGIRAIEHEPHLLKKVLEDPLTEHYMGSEDKILQQGEEPFRPLFRKGLVAGRDIENGEVIASDMVYAMRPQAFSGGLPSEEFPHVVGQRLTRSLKKYEPITRESLYS